MRFYLVASLMVFAWTGQASAAGPGDGEHSFTQLSVGYRNTTCGVRTDDGSIVCWGGEEDDAFGLTKPPTGKFTQVSVGFYHACALAADGTLACWGRNDFGQAKPPEGHFQQVSAGKCHSCALGTDGKVACWGRDTKGELDPPEGNFVQVSAGRRYTCAVREGGDLVCWGLNRHGQADPPSGKFVQVSAGFGYSCGVRSDGKAACWGLGWNEDDTLCDEPPIPCPRGNITTEPIPPRGAFAAVSAGNLYTCGVRPDGSLACWGNDRYGCNAASAQVTVRPPSGAFSAVSVGRAGACAVGRDGKMTCWGQAAAPQDG